jgi:hypothetical protein
MNVIQRIDWIVDRQPAVENSEHMGGRLGLSKSTDKADSGALGCNAEL